MTTPLAIAVGDPAGIGPQVAVDAVVSRLGDDQAILFGDARRLTEALRAKGVDLTAGGVRVVDAGAVDDAIVLAHDVSAEAGAQSLRALTMATDAVREGRARALVTGPMSKEAVCLSGARFRGQTEYLAGRAGLADDAVTMMFLGPRLCVALVTTHASVVDAARSLTESTVLRTVTHLVDALRRLKPGKPIRIDVTGVNPHAGEGGLFGDEEVRVVSPACDAARRSAPDGVRIVGPRAAEASLREAAAGRIDGVVAMLHDQATIASKLLDWGNAVNVTWGLPFVRCSVDHGVAFDAARAGGGDPEGMFAALELARRLSPR